MKFNLETFWAVIWQVSVNCCCTELRNAKLAVGYHSCMLSFHLYSASFSCLNREDRNQLLKSLFFRDDPNSWGSTNRFILLTKSGSQQILRRQERRHSSFWSAEPQKLVQQAAQPSVYVLSLLWHTNGRMLESFISLTHSWRCLNRHGNKNVKNH